MCVPVAASECECKSDVEDSERPEARASESDQNMHVSTHLTLSNVPCSIKRLVWLWRGQHLPCPALCCACTR